MPLAPFRRKESPAGEALMALGSSMGGGLLGGVLGAIGAYKEAKAENEPLPKMHEGGVIPKTGKYSLLKGEKIIPAKSAEPLAHKHINPFEQFTTEERHALSRGEHAPGMIDPFTQRSDEEQQHYCPLKDVE
jgi:hypothetical protein